MKLELNTERVIHGFKMAFACLIAFAITQVSQININQWITITVIVVMCAQPSVGGVLQKSYMRFLGTIGGSLLAMITLLLFGDNLIAIAVSISIAAITFSYLATGTSRYSDSGTLGAATTVIILLGQNPTLLTAFERLLEINMGILIAALVSQFVFPIHARYKLRTNQAATLRQLRDFYQLTLHTDQTEEDTQGYQELDEEIISSLLAQQKLATDAEREIFGKKFNLNNFKSMLKIERSILRSISFMHYAYEESPNRKKVFSHIYVLTDFHNNICDTLQQIADGIENPKNKKMTQALPSIKPLKESIHHALKHTTTDEAEHLQTYLFSAEILIKQLKKLLTLIGGIRP